MRRSRTLHKSTLSSDSSRALGALVVSGRCRLIAAFERCPNASQPRFSINRLESYRKIGRMISNPSSAPVKAKNRGAIQFAALVGALAGALLARPVIKPWLKAHLRGSSGLSWTMLASFAPWVVFSLYWEIQSKNSAPAVSSESKGSRAVHVVLTNAALLLIFMPIPALSRRLLPDRIAVQVIGFVLEFAGVALAIWARRVLGRNWSGEITIKENHELISSGPYRIVRHPIYTALLAMYTCTAVVS